MPDKNQSHTIDVEEDARHCVTPGGRRWERRAQPQKADRKSSEPRRKRLLLVAAALLMLIVAAYFIHDAFLYEDTDDAQIDGHIMPLSAKISGQVQQVNVIEGQVVHAGDVLLVIDPKDYRVAADAGRRESGRRRSQCRQFALQRTDHIRQCFQWPRFRTSGRQERRSWCGCIRAEPASR